MSALDKLRSDAEAALRKLEWPSDESMRPYVQRLLGAPGSCILLGLEFGPDGLTLGRAWISATEREAIKRALRAANKHRARRGECLTTQPETSEPSKTTRPI